eukprot:3893425-Pyramimonas_sp.AAC.1
MAATWGLHVSDLRGLRGRLEALIGAAAKLVSTAHLYPAARGAGCPATCAGMGSFDVKLKATMLVLQRIVRPANISTLS